MKKRSPAQKKTRGQRDLNDYSRYQKKPQSSNWNEPWDSGDRSNSNFGREEERGDGSRRSARRREGEEFDRGSRAWDQEHGNQYNPDRYAGRGEGRSSQGMRNQREEGTDWNRDESSYIQKTSGFGATKRKTKSRRSKKTVRRKTKSRIKSRKAVKTKSRTRRKSPTKSRTRRRKAA